MKYQMTSESILGAIQECRARMKEAGLEPSTVIFGRREAETLRDEHHERKVNGVSTDDLHAPLAGLKIIDDGEHLHRLELACRIDREEEVVANG